MKTIRLLGGLALIGMFITCILFVLTFKLVFVQLTFAQLIFAYLCSFLDSADKKTKEDKKNESTFKERMDELMKEAEKQKSNL